jgi:hypothetical protein
MKNCFDCKFCKVSFVELMTPQEKKDYEAGLYAVIEQRERGNYVGQCTKGFTDKMVAFKREHGNSSWDELKKRTDLDLDCHDYHESTKKLIGMSESVQKMIDFLDKKPI